VIPRPPVATFLASLAAHGGALAMLFVLVSGESKPGVLFVDLGAVSEREAPEATAERPPAPSGGGASTTAPWSARQIRRDSGRPGPSAGAPEKSVEVPSPIAPAAPTAPEPLRERVEVSPPTEEPRQPEPAVAIVPARETAPDVVARSEVNPTAEGRATSGPPGERSASGTDQGAGRTTPGAGLGGQSTGGQGGGGAGAGVALGGPAGGAPGAEYGGYLNAVRRRILEALRYPPPARSRGLKGTVQLEIFIQPDGAISTVSVTGSSSHPLLDEAAVEAVRSLAPQPFPKGLTPRPLRVRLPVVFDLQ
jgi:periplasmic protein TonB